MEPDPEQPDIEAILAASDEAGPQVEAILTTTRMLWRFYCAASTIGFTPEQALHLTTEYFRLLWAQATQAKPGS